MLWSDAGWGHSVPQSTFILLRCRTGSLHAGRSKAIVGQASCWHCSGQRSHWADDKDIKSHSKEWKAEETQKEHFLRTYSVPAPIWGLYVNCVSIPAALWLDSLRTFHHSLPQFSAGERGVQDNQSLTTHTTPSGHPGCLPFLPQWPESDVANTLWREGRWFTLLMRIVMSVVLGLKQRFILGHHIIWMGPPDSFPAWLL